MTLREKLEKVRDEHHEESDEGTPEMWCAKCGAFEVPCDSRRLAEVALVLTKAIEVYARESKVQETGWLAVDFARAHLAEAERILGGER